MQKLITALLLPAMAMLLAVSGAFLSGKVTDENGEDLIGATVILSSKDTTISTMTDVNGAYKMALPDGDYKMTVSYTGYQSYELPVLKIRGRDLQHSITLHSNSIAPALNETVGCYKVDLVRADQTPGGKTRSSDQIKNLPTRPVNTIVSTTPGTNSVDGGAVTIKGSRSNATNYYIDGIRVAGSIPPVQDIEQLQDVTGGLGAEYEEVSNGAISAPVQSSSHQDMKKKENAASRGCSVSGMAAVERKPQVQSYTTASKARLTPKSAKPPKEKRYSNGVSHDTVVPESSTEQYNKIVENPFLKTKDQAFSTFSIDVDAASYSNTRRYINAGQMPPPDAVRIEEMINYFDYQYPQPENNAPIRIVTELGKCPWNTEHHLLMVGLQGRTIEQQQVPASNLVFLVDVSGSMGQPNKLPLVQQSLHLLLDELRPSDRVALVTYAGNTAVILKSTPASDKATIKAAIDQLGAGGGTAGASGIQLAYSTARTNFMEQGNNRVILCTDGDFNIGQSSEKELVDLIDTEKKSGVYLTVLGFGTGNYQDGKMQELADRGNGNHAYIDQIGEAKKVLVKEFAGTLFTIAKDVKLQLEFNPDQVSSYRLIGYENRMLAKEDFDNDAKDAGELGAGHTVTALYEIVPNVQSNQAGDLVKLKFRYKPPTGEQASLLVEKVVPAVCAAKMSDNFNFASAVAEFGLLLRNSAYKGTATWNQVITNASNGLSKDAEGYRAEFLGMVKKVEGIK